MKKLLNNKGFTMVELIIVIAIIAVLAAVLAPQYLRFVEDSRISADKDTATKIESTINTLVAAGDYQSPAAGASVNVTWNHTTGVIGGTLTNGTDTVTADPSVFYAQLNADATDATSIQNSLGAESGVAQDLTWTIAADANGILTVTASDNYKNWGE